MKIVHCSTSVGYSSANYRIHKALLEQNIESDILVLKKNDNNLERVYEIGEYGIRYRIYERLSYYLNICEFLIFDKIIKLQKGMPFTSGIIGIDVSKIPLIQEADVIHLHCVNGAYLSLGAIKKLFGMKKSIVITLHDSWFVTGGCHVLNGCSKYITGCCNCSELDCRIDVAKILHRSKVKLFEKYNGILTAPSNWTRDNAQNSKVAQRIPCFVIGNTLDYNKFNIMTWEMIQNEIENIQEKGKIRILFGALNSTKTPYKGFSYLVDLLKRLKENNPSVAEKIELNIFGAAEENIEALHEYECHFWGYVSDERKLAAIYNLCDVYIVPSLEDSFNQTVLESCACGTPVVSFRTGGICDIIEHKITGYLAEYKSVEDLEKGLLWIIENNVDNQLGKKARKKVIEKFSQDMIAKKFIEVYANKHDRENVNGIV